MTSRIASLRLQLIDAVSGPAKSAANAARGLEKNLAQMGKDSVPGAQRLARELDWVKKKSEAAFRFTSERRELTRLYKDFRDARSSVQRISETLAIASKEPKKFSAAIGVLKRDLTAANAALRTSTSAFQGQKAAVSAAERALQLYGINGARAAARSQQALRDQMAQTIRQIRQLEREQRRAAGAASNAPPSPRRAPNAPAGAGGARSPASDVNAGGAVVGGYVAYQGRNAAERGFGLAVDFSEAADFQAAVGRFNPEERSSLNKQAQKIGGDTRFTNVDVVRAQTLILQRGIRDTQAIMDLTENVTNYALAMGVTLEQAADTVVGSALSKRIDLTPDALRKHADFLVWMSKNSGMSDDDVRQFMKYGGAPTTAAGLPDPYSAAIGMVLSRSGVRGDEAGVFARSMSGKLVAPTQKGREALWSMGIDYNKFVTMPDAMNPAGLGLMMKNKFGKNLPPAMQKRVNDLISNGEFTDPETGETRSVASDSGEFTSQMSKILSPLFGGKMKAQDAKALSKAIGDYWKYSIESVDTVGLFKAIMESNPTLANLNAVFTEKQGGRASMIAQQWGLFLDMLAKMQQVPDGIANKIGVEANSGLYGDWTKLTGTVETALKQMVEDWEGPIRKVITSTDQVVDGFLNLSEGTRKLIEAFLAAVAVFGAYTAGKGAMGVLDGLMGGGKGAGAGGKAGGLFKNLLGKGVKVGGAVGVAATALQVLGEADKSGTFWGLLDGPNEAAKKYLGFDPAKSEWVKSPTERYQEGVQADKKAAIEKTIAPLDDAIASWPEKAKSAMMDYGQALVDGGANAETKAAAAAAAIEAELTFTAHPDIDTGAFERALNLARSVAAAVRSIEGGSAGGEYKTPPNSNPSLGGPRRHGGSVTAGKLYWTGEEGPEPFIPPQNGRIMSNRDFRNAMSGGASGGRPVTVSMPVSVKIEVNGASAADLKRAGEDAAQAVMSSLRSLGHELSRSQDVTFTNLTYGDA